MSRTGLRLATATPALAALRLAHEHTHARTARETHAARMRASPATCTCTHTATSGPSSTSHERSEVGCRWGSDAAYLADNCFYLRYVYARFAFLVQSKKILLQSKQKAHKEACRAPGFASPLPRLRSLLCALHTSTRVQSTLVTHAPCVRASPAVHMLSRGNTRLHTSKAGCDA